MRYIGIDVHKRISTYCVLNDAGKVEMERDGVLTTAEGFRELMEYAAPRGCRILIENSTRSHFVYHLFAEAGYDIIAAHAVDLAAVSRSKVKNDRIDAYRLAQYLMRRDRGEVQFSISNITSRDNMRRRALCRLSADLVRMKTDMVRRMREYMSLHDVRLPPQYVSLDSQRALRALRSRNDPVLTHMVAFLETMNERIEALEEEISKEFGEDDDVRLLVSIPGMGVKTAAAVVAAVDGIERFDSAQKLVSYLGVDPVSRESAGKRRPGRISKDGDPLVRYLLNNVALNHVRLCPQSAVSEFHRRLRQRMEHRKALTATVRKIVCVIWALLTRREAFRVMPC